MACLLVAAVLSLAGAVPPSPGLSFPLPPDTRPAGCSAHSADPSGNEFTDMMVSIIIPYRNEKWEHIKGSIEAILHFTPMHLVTEIIFVSDGNAPDKTYEEDIKAMSPSIRVLILPEVGLIEAKVRAVEATSDSSSVLMFLEPHIRPNKDWLQPLLARVRKYPNVLAQPVLDHIPQTDFSQYHGSIGGIWRFEWNLNLIFTNPPTKTKASPDQPFTSPATSGGIFAIRKDWWNKLGLYDDGMVGWGGDHIEATFKVWRCGGHIEMVPCSRIGHLFRDPSYRPYDVEVPQVVANYRRIAEVWLDEYLPQFYKMKPDARERKLGRLTKPKALREQLQCKSMKWFLENVDVEMGWEAERICVPNCAGGPPPCCKKPGAPGRSTIDRVMPAKDYRTPKWPDYVFVMPASKREL